MKKSRLAFLTFLIISLALFLSGCSSTPTNQAPNASFSANPTSGEAPLEVSLDATNSSDPDGEIISYNWDFGDGSTGSGATKNHTYDNPGDYSVELTVTDDAGATDIETVTISVTSSNQAPTASINADPTSGDAPLEVTFDASGSSDSDGNIASYEWDFGDGATGSGSSVDHTFDSSGAYSVELTVTDNDGATDTASVEIEVSGEGGELNARILVVPPGPGQIYTRQFTAALSTGDIASYEWDFKSVSNPGTATDSGVEVSHTYQNKGTYTVELVVSGSSGATDMTTKDITIG